MIDKLVSGGQRGADYGALVAARKCGVQTGGFAPKGYLTERGACPVLKNIFLLEESIHTGYMNRTMENVDFSDGTVVFIPRPELSRGSRKTIGYCNTAQWIGSMKSSDTGYKPVLVATEFEDNLYEKITGFVQRNDIRKLNIAGQRESKVPGIENQVEKVMREVFEYMRLLDEK